MKKLLLNILGFCALVLGIAPLFVLVLLCPLLWIFFTIDITPNLTRHPEMLVDAAFVSILCVAGFGWVAGICFSEAAQQ